MGLSGQKFFAFILIITYLKILILIRKISTQESQGCLHPGIPINGKISPDKAFYTTGENITFECKESFVLIGKDTSECVKNKVWSSSVPYCRNNIAFEKKTHCLRLEKAKTSEILPDVVTDDDPETCVQLTIDGELEVYSWFEKPQKISEIYVHVKNFSKTDVKLNLAAVFSIGYPLKNFTVNCNFDDKEETELDDIIFQCKIENAAYITYNIEILQLTFKASHKFDMAICNIMGFSLRDQYSIRCDTIREFDCGNSICIPFSQVCDGVFHCWDGRDESVSKCNKPASLIFINNYDIRDLDFELDGKQRFIVKDLKDGFGVDYYYRAEILVWTDIKENAIQSAPIDMGKPITNIITRNILTADGIAVDWIYEHIYWTDREKNTIEVADLYQNFRKLIFQDKVEKPRALALNPLTGWMYWTDWGQFAKIERSGMDGSHRQTLISDNIAWPNGIAIDFVTNRIYWTEGKLDIIFSVNSDGTNRETVLASSTYVRHPLSIDIYQNSMFWTDWYLDSIIRAELNGNNASKVVDKINTIKTLRVYHLSKQPVGKNLCGVNNGNCSHLCLPSPKLLLTDLGYSCACPDEFNYMNGDESNCTAPDHMILSKNTCVESPEPPVNGRISPFRSFYLHKDSVRIICEEGFILFGHNIRTCNEGVWNNDFQICENNVLYQQEFRTWKHNIKYIPCQEQLTDGNSNSYFTETVSSKSVFITDLLEPYSIESISLIIHVQSKSVLQQSLEIIIEIENSSTTHYILCTSSSTSVIWLKNKIQLNCNGNNTVGQLIRIVLIAQDLPVKMQLAELNVFANKPLKPQSNCRIFERSPNCIVRELFDSDGNQFLAYSPEDGYHLTGNSMRFCENNLWKYDPPQCYRKYDPLQSHNFSTSLPVSNNISSPSFQHSTDKIIFSNQIYKTLFILICTALCLLGFALLAYNVYFKRKEWRIIKFGKSPGRQKVTTRKDSMIVLVKESEEDTENHSDEFREDPKERMDEL